VLEIQRLKSVKACRPIARQAKVNANSSANSLNISVMNNIIMTSFLCTYKGDGQTTLKNSDNAAVVLTDLPIDNGGKGRSFSPTDFFASSLGACAVTIMGKYAESQGQSIIGTTVEITKTMGVEPRRIVEISVKFTFPDVVPAEDRKTYLGYLKTCPVYNSLNSNIKVIATSN
jgi:uncharacterized OsmC-like protein